VQKKRWPFFFFEGRCESLRALSLSDPSSSPWSSSPSPMSMSSPSCSTFGDAICRLSRFRDSCDSIDPCCVLRVLGNSLWPTLPSKVGFVGVLTVDSSSMGLFSGSAMPTGGLGVVGVCSPPVCIISVACAAVLTGERVAIDCDVASAAVGYLVACVRFVPLVQSSMFLALFSSHVVHGGICSGR
jgi:hypothetical protein